MVSIHLWHMVAMTGEASVYILHQQNISWHLRRKKMNFSLLRNNLRILRSAYLCNIPLRAPRGEMCARGKHAQVIWPMFAFNGYARLRQRSGPFSLMKIRVSRVIKRREWMQGGFKFVETIIRHNMLKSPQVNALPPIALWRDKIPIKSTFPTARSLRKMISQMGNQLQHLSVYKISVIRAYPTRSTFISDCRTYWQTFS